MRSGNDLHIAGFAYLRCESLGEVLREIHGLTRSLGPAISARWCGGPCPCSAGHRTPGVLGSDP